MIVDSGPGYKSPDARQQWNDNCEATAQDFETRGLARLAKRSREMSEAHHRSAEGLARAARGMMAQQDSRVIESLPSIAVPTLIVVGEDDAPFLAPTSYMAKKIPHASHVVIPGAGHAANIDRPDAFNSAMSAFLNGLSA